MSPAAIPVLRDHEFTAFRSLIRDAAGIHLTDAKRQLVASRLAPRLRHFGYARYHDYYEHVTRHDRDGSELRQLINCITTNKTDFFREPHHFAFLERNVFPLAERRRGPLLLWSAGCSTGEEPYTMAMVARRYFGDEAPHRVRIIASDIDTAVLARARAGVYDDDRLADVPDALRRASFLRGTGQYAGTSRVRRELAELIEFRHVNLIVGPWAVTEDFDAIFCRNVIIYFDQPTRHQLIERFATRLRPGGHLALGHSESLPPEFALFEPLGSTMFRLRDGQRRSAAVPHGPERTGDRPMTAGTRPLRSLRPHAARPGVSPARSATRTLAQTATHTAALPAAGTAALPYRRIIAGEVFASASPAEVGTVLGSCVAACLFDPGAGVGGMNHFMLPAAAEDVAATARYGVHAMELLINEILRLGGDRSRIVAKVFGAASVLRLNASGNVAEANARFIREFLELEGIPLLGERLGGSSALEVRMDTATGRIRVRELVGAESRRAAAEDQRQAAAYWRQAAAASDEPTLF